MCLTWKKHAQTMWLLLILPGKNGWFLGWGTLLKPAEVDSSKSPDGHPVFDFWADTGAGSALVAVLVGFPYDSIWFSRGFL